MLAKTCQSVLRPKDVLMTEVLLYITTEIYVRT